VRDEPEGSSLAPIRWRTEPNEAKRKVLGVSRTRSYELFMAWSGRPDGLKMLVEPAGDIV
jgi:hypothetical protein